MATKESNEVRNQLHTIQVENLTPAQIASAAGGVYLSRNEQGTQLDTQCIVKSFQSVKVPTLGAVIPNSCTSVTKVGEGAPTAFFNPTVNKTYILLAADVTASGGTIAVSFGLINTVTGQFVKLASSGSMADTANNAFDFRHDVYFDSTMVPAILPTSGTPAHAVCGLAYGEVVQ